MRLCPGETSHRERSGLATTVALFSGRGVGVGGGEIHEYQRDGHPVMQWLRRLRPPRDPLQVAIVLPTTW